MPVSGELLRELIARLEADPQIAMDFKNLIEVVLPEGKRGTAYSVLQSITHQYDPESEKRNEKTLTTLREG